MDLNNTTQCRNCGAAMEPAKGGISTCGYCGSIYRLNNNEDATAVPDTTDNVNPAPAAVPAAGQNDGCGYAIAVFVVLVVVFVLVAFFRHARRSSYSYADTAAIDTSYIYGQPQPEHLGQSELDNLKKLAAINIDRATFKKLCLGANIRREIVLERTFIDDKFSIAGKQVNGLYAHIDYESIGGYAINFSSQYISADVLDISSLTFIINKKRLRYKPQFSAEMVGTKMREYSDEIIYDDKMPMLIKIAEADSVTIVFNSKKHIKKMPLPKDQQQVLKRQLQIYKGLLLGYAK